MVFHLSYTLEARGDVAKLPIPKLCPQSFRCKCSGLEWQRDDMNVTRPDINHVVGDILTSSQHCLNMGPRCYSQNEGKLQSCWSVRISRIWFWHPPKLQLWFHIHSTEITSHISLPLSNGETEVNDQKKKFLFFFFLVLEKKRRNWMQNWPKKAQWTTDPERPFLCAVGRTTSGGRRLISQLITVSVHLSASIIFPSFSLHADK